MPNWNKTKYVFTGSEKEISELNELITKSLGDKTLESGDFKNDWLGFIVKELNEDPQEIDCRGTIENPKLINKTTLKFTTWTAWTSCYELFELICKRFPTLEYYFISEEPGCCVYITNDKDKKYFKFGKKYHVVDKEEIQNLIKVINLIKKGSSNPITNDSIFLRVRKE